MMTMKPKMLAPVPVSSLLLLTACGGAGGPVAVGYETLECTATATCNLVGTAAQGNRATGEISVVQVSGTLRPASGRLVVNDGTYTLVDSNGWENGVATDGSSELVANGSQGYSGTYEYVTAYEQTYRAGGQDYVVPGFIGLGASTALATGTSVFVGEAVGAVGTPDSQDCPSEPCGLLTGGTSRVSVDFGNDLVDVRMYNFDQNDAPIDEIRVDNMVLNNTTFTGGTFSTRKNGGAVDITGAGATTQADGNLYGVDANVGTRPDEAAGVVVSTGNNSVVIGTFIAD